MHKFRLYLSDRTPGSRRAIENLKRILDSSLKTRYSLKILFVGENPRLDAEDKVVETPTAVRVSPAPKKRISGDFSKNEHVLEALELGSGR